jgi:hypothetical protein
MINVNYKKYTLLLINSVPKFYKMECSSSNLNLFWDSWNILILLLFFCILLIAGKGYNTLFSPNFFILK